MVGSVEIGIQPQPIIEQEAGSEGTGDEESEVEQIPVEAPTISREDKIKNAKALSLIQGALTDEFFPRIRYEKTAKGAWEILRTRFFETVNNLKSLGKDVTEKRIVQKLLMSLCRRYKSIVSIIEETRDLDTIRVEEILASVKVYDKREDLHDEKDKLAGTEKAFSSLRVGNNQASGANKSSHGKQNQKWQGQNKKGSNWSQGGNFNNNNGSNWNNGSGGNWNNSFSSQNKQGSSSQGGVKPQCQVCQKFHFGVCRHKGKPRCGKCNRFGHLTKDCDNGKQVANCAKEEEVTTGTMFYACHASSIASRESVWFVDSACSNHMTSQESLLINLDKSVTCKVKMGTGDLVQATGKGTLVVETRKGRRYINEVLLVPGPDENLLSIGQMMEHGCFPLSMESICSMGMKAAVQEDPWIWHRRLGHLNFASMKKMQQTQMVLGLPDFSEKEGVCEGCVYGKSHREPFENEKPWRAKNPLELIHTDVCGPMQNESIGGNKYFITFIDDYSRMCWVYFLRNKSSVISVFKKFKVFVELQIGFNLKKLRSDRGGEYTSHEFLEYCSDLGMERQLTIAYSPQQNGIAERRNITICEMARSMMTEKKISVKFWAEAVGTAVYLQNRCYTTSATDKTPFEAFTGRKPGVKHLRVFGSICYSHIPSNLRQKFDDKASKGIFMGYGSCEKGYRIYNLQTEKIILSRSVVFDENKSWNWESKQDETVHVPPIFENGSSEITETEETSHETHSIASPNLNQLISDDEHVSESNGSGTS
ncbi:hypothetical protein L3X38_027417 [Prunus dulcis]|uniref:Uncharacterized protein n=1 Tax=Prunus dulcis TaxID=3755 RepID=A0AAD4VQ73_PRUDU|nr:hypothetical protein L3X38_027417 [Prunus dulcis]